MERFDAADSSGGATPALVPDPYRLIEELRGALARCTAERDAALQELDIAREYQAATDDVLKAAGRSTLDLQPLWGMFLATAARLCRADKAFICLLRDGFYHLVAESGFTPEYRDLIERNPMRPGPDSMIGRAALARDILHVKDALTDPDFKWHQARRAGNFRTALAVPMIRGDNVIGGFFLTRAEPQPFTERQIDLVRTFAEHAVIAVENTSLLGQLQSRGEELARREAELRTVFENIGRGIALFDADLNLAAWNHALLEILEVDEDFFAEKRDWQAWISMLALRGEFGEVADLDRLIADYRENLGTPGRLDRARPNGRIVELRRNPVPGGGLLLIYNDITERKLAEEDLRAARDDAEAALLELQAAQKSLLHAEKMASLGKLTAGIAHEIKNPLNFVNNFASLSGELLAELLAALEPARVGLDDDQQAEIDDVLQILRGNLGKIHEHGTRADNIVKSMLMHSRGGGGGGGDWRPCDVNALVEESLNLAYHGARAQDQNFNIALERDFAAGLGPIEAVPQDLTRVFLNLFGNGFYAAGKRARLGEAHYRPALKVATRSHGDSVEIRVRDNGTGIPAADRDKLFQPFFTTKPTGEGTGLGLSISYDIVTQQHRGTIAVDSEEGMFTEFTIRLPCRRPAAPGVAA